MRRASRCAWMIRRARRGSRLHLSIHWSNHARTLRKWKPTQDRKVSLNCKMCFLLSQARLPLLAAAEPMWISAVSAPFCFACRTHLPPPPPPCPPLPSRWWLQPLHCPPPLWAMSFKVYLEGTPTLSTPLVRDRGRHAEVISARAQTCTVLLYDSLLDFQ